MDPLIKADRDFLMDEKIRLEAEVAKLREVVTYIDRQVREVWSPPPGDTYQATHRAWCIEQAAKVLKP